MKVHKRNPNRERGQSILLMVLAVGLVGTTIGLLTLQSTQRVFRESVEFRRSLDVVYILNGVARWLQQIYINQANCDPYLFNNKINELTNRVYISQFKLQALDTSNSGYFTVSIGEMNPKPAPPAAIPQPAGTAVGANPQAYYLKNSLVSGGYGVYGPQDVSVTYWITPYGALSAEEGPTRYEQTITLINTCNMIAAITPSNGGAAYNTGPQYGTVSTIPGYLAAAQALVPGTSDGGAGGTLGDADADATIGVLDRQIFSNWIKNGDNTGFAQDPIAQSPTSFDFNYDGAFNEIDLGLMDKSLKGYLFYLVPSTQR